MLTKSCISHRYIIQDLATVNRRRTPWVVVNMHRPIYTSSTAGVAPPSVLRVAEDLQQALEPVFALYQVRSPAAELCVDGNIGRLQQGNAAAACCERLVEGWSCCLLGAWSLCSA